MSPAFSQTSPSEAPRPKIDSFSLEIQNHKSRETVAEEVGAILLARGVVLEAQLPMLHAAIQTSFLLNLLESSQLFLVAWAGKSQEPEGLILGQKITSIKNVAVHVNDEASRIGNCEWLCTKWSPANANAILVVVPRKDR